MSVYANEKYQQISMWDLESTVNVREFIQSTVMKTSDYVSISLFFYFELRIASHFSSWNVCEISRSIPTTCVESS